MNQCTKPMQKTEKSNNYMSSNRRSIFIVIFAYYKTQISINGLALKKYKEIWQQKKEQ